MDVVFSSRLDIMLALDSLVIREAHTFFAGETVLVRHTLINDGPYMASPIRVWLSQFRNPQSEFMYSFTNETAGAPMELAFKFVVRDSNLKAYWYCFELPASCTSCYVHSLAKVDILDVISEDSGELPPTRLLSLASSAEDAALPIPADDAERQLAEESSRLDSAYVDVQLIDNPNDEEEDSNILRADDSSAESGSSMTSILAGAGIMFTVAGLAFAGKKAMSGKKVQVKCPASPASSADAPRKAFKSEPVNLVMFSPRRPEAVC